MGIEMEEKKAKRKSFRFNFIDVILLLIILGAAAILVYIFKSSGSDTTGIVDSNTKEIIYIIEAREVPDVFKGNVNIGDSVVDAVGLRPIGEVVDVTYSEAPFVYEADGSGTVMYSVYPDKLNISIKVRAIASITADSYSIGGYIMSVGTKVYFRTPNLTGESYCISIETGE